MTEPLEIERKFLIEMPERAVLDRCPTRWEIWQTYLLAPPGISARVRRRVGETEQFFHTEKLRLTDRTCVERDREIDAREYEALLAQRDPARVTIHKERYCLPEGGLVFEIDVYPFWRRLAVMEVELQREDQGFTVPRGLRVRIWPRSVVPKAPDPWPRHGPGSRTASARWWNISAERRHIVKTRKE